MSKRKTKEDFIKKAKQFHGGYYNYDLVNYIDNHTKVEIVCPVHGVFEQRPCDHYKHGCPKCAATIISNKHSSSKEDFVRKAKEIYGDYYDYSLVEYKNQHSVIKIICPKHGQFEQTPFRHLHCGGCFKCGLESKQNSEEKIFELLKEKSLKFENLQKNSSRSYDWFITGICPFCYKKITKTVKYFLNDFEVCSCKKEAGISKGEKKILNFLEKNNIIFERNKTFNGLKDKKNLSYDFYLKDYNLLIEYQGEQHYKPKTFGGITFEVARKNFLIQKHHDWLKRKYAKKNGVGLLEISYKDYSKAIEILKNYIGE